MTLATVLLYFIAITLYLGLFFYAVVSVWNWREERALERRVNEFFSAWQKAELEMAKARLRSMPSEYNPDCDCNACHSWRARFGKN